MDLIPWWFFCVKLSIIQHVGLKYYSNTTEIKTKLFLNYDFAFYNSRKLGIIRNDTCFFSMA